MAVLAISSHPKCKLCKHPERPAIDALLEMRSRREQDERGENVNLDYVLRALEAWGVENPNEDNVKNHWKKHCQLVDDRDAAAIDAQASELTTARIAAWNRIFGEDWMDGASTPTPEQILEWQRVEYLFGQYAKVAAGKETGITHDQADRAINTITRRAHEEKADELMALLGRATGMALTVADKAVGALGERDVVEGEVAEDADVVPAGELGPGDGQA